MKVVTNNYTGQTLELTDEQHRLYNFILNYQQYYPQDAEKDRDIDRRLSVAITLEEKLELMRERAILLKPWTQARDSFRDLWPDIYMKLID